MTTQELMEKMFGGGAPYPGMEMDWECFAGHDAMESGIYHGKITSITWCQHCGVPTINVESNEGSKFSVRISKEGRFVCGSEAPE